MGVKTVQEWVDELQASGRYTFQRSEAIEKANGGSEAVSKALLRLVRHRRIARIKNYFFVIVPLEYRSAGCPPASWFIHDLMAAMDLPYYVGLLSAAALHGASHQQPQELQVVTSTPVRPLRTGRVRIRFFVKKHIERTPAVEIKTPSGSMRVSTPEATAVDLVRHPRAAGGLDNVTAILSELSRNLDSQRLVTAAVEAGLSAAQRLGYLLDYVGARRLTASLARRIEDLQPRAVLLRPGKSTNGAKRDSRWQVIVNEDIEVRP